MIIDELPPDFITSMRKREALCKDAKPCPKCASKQVQLVEWVTAVLWRCRECKERWHG